MKCCIDVISLIRYQLVAVVSSVLALQHYHSYWMPEEVFDCKIFVFSLQGGLKVFFFLLKYTSVPLHICTGVNMKWVKRVWGWMLNNEQFKQTGKRWCSHTLKVQPEQTLRQILPDNYRDMPGTLQPLCQYNWNNRKHAAAARITTQTQQWLFLQMRFSFF